MSFMDSPTARSTPLPSADVDVPDADGPPAAPQAPALCRRLLRTELRRLREASGLTGRQVATAMGWSVAKVSRLERAEGALRETEVRAVCLLYRASAQQLAVLTQCAERARAPQWWHSREYRKVLPPGTDDFLGLEATAAEISVYAPESVPDLLRTDEYTAAAAALPHWAAPEVPTSEAVRTLVTAARRRRAVLERPEGAPRLVVVVAESVLHRVLGDREVLRHQLRRLVDASRRPGVQVRVLPVAQGIAPGLGGPFSVLGFSDGTTPIIAREQLTGMDLVDEASDVERYRAAFRALLGRAADATASRELLTAAMNRAAATRPRALSSPAAPPRLPTQRRAAG